MRFAADAIIECVRELPALEELRLSNMTIADEPTKKAVVEACAKLDAAWAKHAQATNTEARRTKKDALPLA